MSKFLVVLDDLGVAEMRFRVDEIVGVAQATRKAATDDPASAPASGIELIPGLVALFIRGRKDPIFVLADYDTVVAVVIQ